MAIVNKLFTYKILLGCDNNYRKKNIYDKYTLYIYDGDYTSQHHKCKCNECVGFERKYE